MNYYSEFNNLNNKELNSIDKYWEFIDIFSNPGYHVHKYRINIINKV